MEETEQLNRLKKLKEKTKYLISDEELNSLKEEDIVVLKNMGEIVYEGLVDGRMSFIGKGEGLHEGEIINWMIKKEKIEVLPSSRIYFNLSIDDKIMYYAPNDKEYVEKRKTLEGVGLM